MSDLDAILGAIEGVRRDLRGDLDRQARENAERFQKGQERFDALADGQLRTNEHLKDLNGKVAEHVLSLGDHATRLKALEDRNFVEDLVKKTRQAQRDEVKTAAFSLVRAVDNKVVTALVLIGLVGVGALGQWVWPW